MALLGRTKRRILLELRRKPYHGYALAAKLGIALAAVYPHLKELRDARVIVPREPTRGPTRRKEYVLTEFGKMLADAVR